MSDLSRILGRTPAPTPASLRTAVITRADTSGVWAAVLGADRRAPLGPCRGATRTRAATLPAGGETHSHNLVREALPVGTVVLLHLDGIERPWIVAWEESDA